MPMILNIEHAAQVPLTGGFDQSQKKEQSTEMTKTPLLDVDVNLMQYTTFQQICKQIVACEPK